MLAALCLPVAARADVHPLPESWDPQRFISTDEIEVGMRGYGLTVLKGTTVERFDVEVVGVIKNRMPGRDAIIARMTGLGLEDTGVIAGMSGSPVFLDGRLAGAVAFGWSFMEEPIGGITPIQYMLPLLGKPGAEPQDMAPMVNAEDVGIELSATQVREMTGAKVDEPVRLEPLATPLLVSGASPELLAQAREWFAPYGIVPVGGGGTPGGLLKEHNPPLAPGAAVAIPMIEGDLGAIAVGTVTHVEGDHVVAFGHQFRHAGPIALPMGNAYVLGVLPMQTVSTKMAVALHTLGTVQQDQMTGIAGTVGPVPPMIPLTVHVTPSGADGPLTYRYHIAPDRGLMASLFTLAGGASVTDAVSLGAPFSARIAMNVAIRDHDPIEVRAFATGSMGAAAPVAANMLAYLTAILDNPYGRLALDGLEVNVEVARGIDAAYLEEVRPGSLRVRPGETLPITLVYRVHEGPRLTGRTELRIPDSAPDGPATLVVSDATRTVQLETRRSPMRFRPGNLEQYLEILNMQFPENELTVSLLSPQPGMALAGEELPLLPGSVLSVMGQSGTRALAMPTRATVLARTELALERVAVGMATVQIMVDSHAP